MAEPIETIKAKTEKLTGPTVIGRIVLPVVKEKSTTESAEQADRRKRKRIKKVNVEKTAQETTTKKPFQKGPIRKDKPAVTEVEIQKEIVDEKNREITDSINYAKRIQEAILPNQEMFKTHLPESFILYKPKDIVAGDFYWLEKFEDQIIFAVADCTGHGVPGAMVSVVCHNALNRAVKEFGLIEPDKILNKTRELVIGTFEKGDQTSQVKSGDVIRDGMDIALCVLNTKTNELAFAGANNGLYHLHNNEITELIPDKQPIGKYAEERNFTTQKISMLKGDLIYLFSDGYADQFGGPEGKKFKYKQLKELLQKNASLKLNDQLTAVNNAFEKWKGNLEQVDDVCLMGVRI